MYDAMQQAGFLDPDPNEAMFTGVDSSGNSLSPMPWGNILKAGGSIFSAFGDIMAGNQEAAADQYNANLALEQEQFQLKNLEHAEESTLSSQRAIYARSGVTMSGSPLDVALNTATQFEMDKQITKYNAESRANMYNYEGEVAKSRGKIKAGESLLSGAAGLLGL